MANYTLTLQQILNNVEIFDFDFPMFNEEYRKIFQDLFIDQFLTEEIAHETIGLFKHRLKTKLNLIMPFYNKLYMAQNLDQRILDNYDVTEIYVRNVDEVNTAINKNLYKDAPKTKIDIDKFDTVTNLSKNEGNVQSNQNEKWTRTMQGNIGIQTDADAIIKYNQSLRNITNEIFEKELIDLFMGVF